LWRRKRREIKIVEEEEGINIFTQNLYICVVGFYATSLKCTIYESVNRK